MQVRFLKSSVLTAFTLLLTAGTVVSQDDPTTPQETVYSLCSGSGTCSRTARVVATFANVQAACEAAEKLRSDRAGDDGLRVGIFTGKANPWVFFPAHREQLKPESCSVVLKGCKRGWFIHDKPMDLKSAEAIIVEVRDSGLSVEMIYHFPLE